MSFHCSVVTPERAVLECEAASVVFPAHDGEMGILTNRAPLLCQLGIGVLRIAEESGPAHTLVIDGGFAQMVDNKLTILTQKARKASEIERAAARQALEEAMAREAHSEREHEERQKDIQRARTQLKVAVE